MRDRPNETHRRVVESKLGRKLKPSEIVHHQDENKANNAPGNLTPEERAKHTADHNRARGLSKLRRSLRMVSERKKLY